jgi:hypothetical protein
MLGDIDCSLFWKTLQVSFGSKSGAAAHLPVDKRGGKAYDVR